MGAKKLERGEEIKAVALLFAIMQVNKVNWFNEELSVSQFTCLTKKQTNAGKTKLQQPPAVLFEQSNSKHWATVLMPN